jgi:hypothetical protein
MLTTDHKEQNVGHVLISGSSMRPGYGFILVSSTTADEIWIHNYKLES